MATLWDLLEPRPPRDGPPVPRLLPAWPWNKVTEYRDLDGGETIVTRVGRQFSISKHQYSDADVWEANIGDTNILALIGTEYRNPELPFLGTSGLKYFIFNTLAPGETIITLYLRRAGTIIPDAVLLVRTQVS